MSDAIDLPEFSPREAIGGIMSSDPRPEDAIDVVLYDIERATTTPGDAAWVIAFGKRVRGPVPKNIVESVAIELGSCLSPFRGPEYEYLAYVAPRDAQVDISRVLKEERCFDTLCVFVDKKLTLAGRVIEYDPAPRSGFMT